MLDQRLDVRWLIFLRVIRILPSTDSFKDIFFVFCPFVRLLFVKFDNLLFSVWLCFVFLLFLLLLEISLLELVALRRFFWLLSWRPELHRQGAEDVISNLLTLRLVI